MKMCCSISDCSGSEVDPDEVQEALPVVWHTLVETGPPDAKHLRIFGRERGRIHAVRCRLRQPPAAKLRQ